MKRFITILMILACVLSVSVTAFSANEVLAPVSPDATVDEDTYKEEPKNNDSSRFADGEAGRGSIEAPDKYWGETGYPDDISFAYKAGGEKLKDGTIVSWWEIGIVNADDSRKQEIIDMLSPNCFINFIDCQYSYNQRETAYSEILASEDDNIHDVIMLRNSEEVLVVVSKEHLKEYALKFEQQYGSLVDVTDELGANDLNENDAVQGGVWTWPIFAILLVGAAFIVYFNRTRLIPAMQTTKGTIVTQSAPVSRKETIAAIKNREVAPSDKVLNSILHRIAENAQ